MPPFTVTNVICRFNSASGGPTRTVSMISQASVGYWRAELFTTDFIEPVGDRLLVDKYCGHRNVLGRNAQGTLGGALRLLRLFRSHETQLVRGVAPDLMHIHGLWNPLLAAFASSARRHGIPYVVATHGMLDPRSLGSHGLRKSFALRSYQGIVLEHAAAIHATSLREAEDLRRLPWVRSQIYVVPNAVDSPSELPPASEPLSPSEPKTLLFLSRLHPQKGLDMLLQAWNELRPANWQLVIAGSGAPAYVERLKQQCSAEQNRNVQFFGQVDGNEREAMYRRAAALVLPSYSESFSNTVAEALIRGIPVITTTGTPWAVLQERACGWYVEPQFEPLKRALLELFETDPVTLRVMGERGRTYARANFSIDAVRGALLRMYNDVLGRTSAAEHTLSHSEPAVG